MFCQCKQNDAAASSSTPFVLLSFHLRRYCALSALLMRDENGKIPEIQLNGKQLLSFALFGKRNSF